MCHGASTGTICVPTLVLTPGRPSVRRLPPSLTRHLIPGIWELVVSSPASIVHFLPCSALPPLPPPSFPLRSWNFLCPPTCTDAQLQSLVSTAELYSLCTLFPTLPTSQLLPLSPFSIQCLHHHHSPLQTPLLPSDTGEDYCSPWTDPRPEVLNSSQQKYQFLVAFALRGCYIFRKTVIIISCFTFF